MIRWLDLRCQRQGAEHGVIGPLFSRRNRIAVRLSDQEKKGGEEGR